MLELPRSYRPSFENRQRVFVSSVVEGFKEFRQAARDGIQAAGGQPILVNGDYPSLSTSSRNACLGAVQSSDVYISIMEDRGSYQTPSNDTNWNYRVPSFM